MSTRSFIGKIREDRSVDVIYCHFDGYLDHVGKILHQHYLDSDQVDQLLALGDLSCLYSKLVPNPDYPHSFKRPQSGVTVAYGRDRGEVVRPPQHYENLQEFFIDYDDSWCEWIYLYDMFDHQWYYAHGIVHGEDDLLPLAKAFADKPEEEAVEKVLIQVGILADNGFYDPIVMMADVCKEDLPEE